jgi:hypothetical protein
MLSDEPDMSFSFGRYECQGASDPILGMRLAQWTDPKAQMPIIPNIGSLHGLWVYFPHIAHQKKTCP